MWGWLVRVGLNILEGVGLILPGCSIRLVGLFFDNFGCRL